MGLVENIRKRFSAAAESYSQSARVQERAALQLAGELPDLPEGARILEVGCGTGFLTRRLAGRYPDCRIEALDVSAEMIEQARRQVADVAAWHVSDVLDFSPVQAYDLIASSSALHWIDDLGALFRHLRGLLRPGGQIVFSIMLEGTFRELHAARVEAVPEKPLVRRLPAEATVRAAVESAGLRLAECIPCTESVEYESARAFLREIRAQGVSGGGFFDGGRYLSHAELVRLCRCYDERSGTESGGVCATFERALFRSVLR